MKILSKLWRILVRGCAITTLITSIMFLVVTLTSTYDSIRINEYLLILGFSMIIALSIEVLYIRSLPLIVRLAIQYLALLVSFLLIFISSGNIQNKPGTIIIFVFIFTAAYALLAAAILLLLKAFGYYQKHLAFEAKPKTTSNKAPYQSRFQ